MPNRLHVKHLAQKHHEEQPTTNRRATDTPDQLTTKSNGNRSRQDDRDTLPTSGEHEQHPRHLKSNGNEEHPATIGNQSESMSNRHGCRYGGNIGHHQKQPTPRQDATRRPRTAPHEDSSTPTN